MNRKRGRVANLDGELLEALCEVFQVEPGKLLERERTWEKGRKRTKA